MLPSIKRSKSRNSGSAEKGGATIFETSVAASSRMSMMLSAAKSQSKLANSLPNLPSRKKSSASRTLMNGDLDAAIAALRAKEGPRLMSRRMTESLPLPSSAARATFAVSSLDASSTTTTSGT